MVLYLETSTWWMSTMAVILIENPEEKNCSATFKSVQIPASCIWTFPPKGNNFPSK
jgi:hypothetical protein